MTTRASAPAYGHELRHDAETIRRSLDSASGRPYWLDNPARPAPRAALAAAGTATDLLVVGGGFAGLWTALIAKERDPQRRVVLIEGQRIGWAASGRNGGFCEADLTHGGENGELHFRNELETIRQLAEENFRGIVDTVDRYDIDADFELSSVLKVANDPHQVAALKDAARAADLPVLEGEGLARVADSPIIRAGVFHSDGIAFVDPAKLAWGLARAAESLGVEVYENTQALSIRRAKHGVKVRTTTGTILAHRVALATNGFPSLLRRLRLFTVPVYDYALMTEPLSDEQFSSIGWTGNYGITDSGRQFHYYRKTADNRILWGGYDAIYHRGRKILPEYDQRRETFERLADHFFSTFPQLGDVAFTHKWGGMIDMSTKLVAFHGKTRDHRIAYSAGYTGLGVGATRFGAETMLDFLENRETARTRLRMARRLPIPVPPEPVAYPLIETMRRAVARSDANGGRDGFLIRVARLFKVGFDS